jgi:hypothetical protein
MAVEGNHIPSFRGRFLRGDPLQTSIAGVETAPTAGLELP